MRDRWGEAGFAQGWDQTNAARDNPDRGEQLDLLAALLADAWKEGDWLLDLGSGSGQVEELIFRRVPSARAVGVDSSPHMMRLASERLAPFPGRFEGVEAGMASLGRLSLPHAPFAFALSVQALHELPHPEKRGVFAQVFRLLRPGGSFFLLDRVEPAFAKLPASYKSVWDRLNRRAALPDPMTYEEYVAKYGGKKDHPARLEDLISWLEEAGFAAAPLYLHFNRVLIAARREE